MLGNHYENFDVECDWRGVTTVTLNVPGRPLNVLTPKAMAELDQIIRNIEDNGDVRLVVFRSGKESGFLAGADVGEIASIESGSAAGRLIENGQLIFQRIEWLSMPTVAVIHGPCLGGGLEWSLACDHRVARNNSSTKIGLPEIKLGLIPGWGGTQRLPKCVGLSASLPLILTGKHLDAAQAAKIGLIDRAIDPSNWDDGLDRFIEQALQGTLPTRSRSRPNLMKRLADGTRIGRAITMRMARRATRSKVKHFPALRSALRAIETGFEPGPAGFACERDEFVKLLATPTCRNLLGLFFARERARSLSTWSPGAGHAAHDEPIRQVGVVGAGAMGAGIGQLSATRGYDVVIKEINPQAAEAGRHRVEKLVDGFAKRKGWGNGRKQKLIDKIVLSCDSSALSDCVLVIEAVVERDDVKAEVFGMLDRVVQSNAILSSNTSSLSVSRMAEATDRPSKVAGLHFFNPVHRMELVEVVRAEKTDDETIARLVAFVRALGKTPVVTADSPGFLVNRVLFPYLGEAVLMVAEGMDVATIDKQIRRFGMPMGPLELLDQVGLDVALHVAGSLDGVLPEVGPVVEHLRLMVDRGNLGKKSGVGFYQYKKGKRRDPASLPPFIPVPPIEGDHEWAPDDLTPIQRRLVYPMLAESVRCLDEQVVAEAWAIDLAMVLGTGFAPQLGGPLHLVDSIGRDAVRENLRRLEMIHGARFAPPNRLQSSRASGGAFFFDPPQPQPSHSTST